MIINNKNLKYKYQPGFVRSLNRTTYEYKVHNSLYFPSKSNPKIVETIRRYMQITLENQL